MNITTGNLVELINQNPPSVTAAIYQRTALNLDCFVARRLVYPCREDEVHF